MKKSLSTTKAPKAIGPYSQAIRFGNTLYCSGQISLDPQSMEMVGQDVKTQTQQVMKNLAAVLEEAGLNFDSVVKFTVYLKDMGDFAVFNECYAEYLKAPFPARACVQAAKLPKDALVEIDAVACYA